MKKYIFHIVLISMLAASCQTETEVINREILVRDTVLVDPNADFLGGVSVRFIYCDEYMQNEDTILPDAEVLIRLADTVLRSETQRDGTLIIEGLEPGKFYGAEVYLKGTLFGSFDLGPAGANYYADYTPFFFIIDISNTELQSDSVSISEDNQGALEVNINVKLKELPPPFTFNERGALVCLSKSADVSNYEADLYRSNVIFNPNQNPIDSLDFQIEEILMLNAGFEKGDRIYYKIYGASRDKTSSSPNQISSYYPGHEFAYHPYVTVNPNFLEGSFIWDK